MSISDELAKLIPVGEENAVSGLLLLEATEKMWSPMSIKHTLRLMARDGRIERKQVQRDGRETKRGRGSGVVGYNVQVAVDTKPHLIVVNAF